MSDDDQLLLLEDDDAPAPHAPPPWRVLVIDDDHEVHEATRFALRDARILGRPLALAHVGSAAEARAYLPGQPDIAVILLDVVMETEDAGLALIDFIRRDCGLEETRIILRTGQPGYAPELGIVDRYDINDYRTKGELTRTRLITALSAAIRSYDQIRTIAENRRGLALIVEAAPGLLKPQALGTFAEGVLVQLASLLGASIDGIVCAQRGSPFDVDDRRMYVVGAAGSLAAHVAQPLDDLPVPAVAEAINAAFEARAHVFRAHESVLYLDCGEYEAAVYIATMRALEPLDLQLLGVFGANIAGCYGNLRRFEDVTYIAFHDVLTALGNRTGFLRDLDALAIEATPTVVALIDIHQFADLNDGLGHDVGNALLVAVGERLRQAFGRDCVLARVGADVFGIAGPEGRVGADALHAVFEAPFECLGHRLPAQATIGLCMLMPGGEGGLRALKRATIALNRAKKSLSAFHAYFLPEMEDATRERLALVHRLREDLARGALEVWFQPQVAFDSREVRGIEALVRWPDGHGGMVQPPDVFIPLAEYAGLVGEIGRFVLERACAAMARLQGHRQAPARVAVNVAMPQFREAGFVAEVQATLRAHGLAPGALEVEITESIAMDEPKRVADVLAQLRALGVRVAIDDFGTGYSSLAQLRDMPIDVLKLDRGFISEITAGRGGLFAETIVGLGHRLGLETVAEGVETPEQAAFLRALDCRTAQGFLFAKPMPLPALEAWLEAWTP